MFPAFPHNDSPLKLGRADGGPRSAGEVAMEFVSRMMDAFDVKDAPSPVLSGFRMRQDSKIERLQQVPLLQECTARQLREVARIAHVFEAPAGTVLTRAGEPG